MIENDDMIEQIESHNEEMMRTEKSEGVVVNHRIQHAILGIADESGELVTALKAATYYNRPFDMVNLKEELGDMWWYYTLFLDEIAVMEGKSVTQVFKEILAMNKKKLRTRYPEGYSDDKANQRDLAKERMVLEDAQENKEKAQK